MRIERLEIDGFGRFHDATWQLGDGLTVLLGANEAGKTTLLNALRALLFGFEATRDGRTWYPALAGGRRGGRLRLRTRRGETWTVERHGERGGSGALAVRAPSGNQGGQETLDRLLHGADRDLFNNIFAFGLGELQTLASLSADGVRGRIYGAGNGLGGTSALDLERVLRKQLDDVFLPRGRERPLNQVLARIEELRGEIADLSRQPQEHADAHREREALRRRATQLREAVRSEREREARARRLLEARASAAEADMLARDLAIGDAELDRIRPDAVAIVERHEAAIDDARRTLEALDAELATSRSDRDRISTDPALMAAAEQVIAVRDARAARVGADDRRQELEAALSRHAQSVAEQAARAGIGDEAALLALDDSIAAVERTRELERAIARARSVSEAAEHRAGVLRDELAAREREATPGGPDRSDTPERIEALHELDALRVRRAVASARSADGPWSRGRAWAPIVVAAAALVTGVAVGQAVIGAVAGLLLAIAAWWALGRTGTGGGAELTALDAERSVLLARAGLPPDADDEAVRQLAAELATQRARADIASDHRSALEARRRELATADLDRERSAGTLADAEAAWSAWLVGAGLPADLSPEAARQVLAAAGAARRAAVERDEHRRRVAAIDAETAVYAAQVDALAARLGSEVGSDPASRDAFVMRAAERLEAAREAERRSRELDAALERLATRRRAAADAVTAREKELAAFLGEHGCRDADGLRARAADAGARADARARLRELRATLAGMAGGADGVDGLVEQSLAADPAQLEAERADARQQAERLDDEERQVLNRIGALDARIDQLEHADELGARRQELAGLEGRAAALAREWAVRALALRLLTETRSRYERDRQPDVIRAASQHFERITDGRYSRVVAPPGDGDVRVETDGGEAKATDQLSRGTAEQLYLALRFGLIEEFARNAEPLPVVMDDILVNFDVDRAARAAAAIRDLAERHQVLYFTCHRHLAELLDPGGERTLALG